MAPDEAAKIEKLVVKLGTSTLCDSSGAPDHEFLSGFAAQTAALVNKGVACVVVSSGAIRAGLGLLSLPHAPRSIPLKQAAAAVGQGRLMQLYADVFAAHGLVVAQVLLTRDDFHDRARYINASNTLRALLRLGVVPIVNENDTIAVDEIKVGDNDTLAALVAGLVGADLLVLLSDIDGFFSADPNLDSAATLVRRISNLGELPDAGAGDSKGVWGTGGMRTKIEAARLCVLSRIPMVIANGRRPGVLADAIAGETGTWFEAASSSGALRARKRWIAGGQRVKGALRIHRIACGELIQRGRSLLAAGVLAVEGEFASGDLVALADEQGEPFARGIVNYDSATLAEIKGLRSAQVRTIVGETALDEVVHRDNMVVSGAGSGISPIEPK